MRPHRAHCRTLGIYTRVPVCSSFFRVPYCLLPNSSERREGEGGKRWENSTKRWLSSVESNFKIVPSRDGLSNISPKDNENVIFFVIEDVTLYYCPTWFLSPKLFLHPKKNMYIFFLLKTISPRNIHVSNTKRRIQYRCNLIKIKAEATTDTSGM